MPGQARQKARATRTKERKRKDKKTAHKRKGEIKKPRFNLLFVRGRTRTMTRKSQRDGEKKTGREWSQ
jgi:hypothetical protein